MPARILYLVASLDRTAAAQQLSLLARRLPPSLEPHVCALGGGPLETELRQAAIPVTVLGNRRRGDPQTFWRLKQHVARLQPDLVHSWLGGGGVFGYAAARAGGARRAIVARRGTDPGSGWFSRAAQRCVARHCDRMVLNSPHLRDFHIRGGLPAEKIRVIADAAVAPASPVATRGQLLAELGLPGASRLIGVVGQLRPPARLKDAIWACDLLKVIRDDVHLLVIGDGPQRDRLLRYRDQVLIVDKVHFLRQRGDLPRWMPHFDVLWSTGDCPEQTGAILEAMAAGVPVVAADVPGARELVLPEATGYLVELGDRAGFARWTNHLLDDAALAHRLGEAGRERAGREFSTEKMVAGYVGLYGELLAGPGGMLC